MPKAKCWACTAYFKYGSTDTRPYIYHKHPDGTLVANDNPNLIRPPRKWYPSNPTKQKKTFWQDWQHFDTKTGD